MSQITTRTSSRRPEPGVAHPPDATTVRRAEPVPLPLTPATLGCPRNAAALLAAPIAASQIRWSAWLRSSTAATVALQAFRDGVRVAIDKASTLLPQGPRLHPKARAAQGTTPPGALAPHSLDGIGGTYEGHVPLGGGFVRISLLPDKAGSTQGLYQRSVPTLEIGEFYAAPLTPHAGDGLLTFKSDTPDGPSARTYVIDWVVRNEAGAITCMQLRRLLPGAGRLTGPRTELRRV